MKLLRAYNFALIPEVLQYKNTMTIISYKYFLSDFFAKSNLKKKTLVFYKQTNR